MKRMLFTTSAIVLMLGQAANAASTATALTDLNLRAGPGPEYKIEGVITNKDTVEVMGCVDASNWCKVNYDGMSGWAYGDYLSTLIEDTPMQLTTEPARTTITTIEVEDKGPESRIGGAAVGTVAGILIGGPVAVATGAVAGLIAGDATAPDPKVMTYVENHPVNEPIFLEGEVVAGAGIPDSVTLVPVPDSEFSYLNVNGQTVIVKNDDRKIIRILR